jgi:hypothetical protein
MGEFYLSQYERTALKAIDDSILANLIDNAIWSHSTSTLDDLPLFNCGQYVARKLQIFNESVSEHGKSKATRKRNETENRAHDAGRRLLHAVSEMKSRMDLEEKETQLFRVDDQILPPRSFNERLEVRISYQWRPTIDESWTYGNIKFVYDVAFTPNYFMPTPKRKPSAAKHEDERQERLCNSWDHLKSAAFQSVLEYLRSGNDRSAIPEKFDVRVDPQSGGTNNFSFNFWQEGP